MVTTTELETQELKVVPINIVALIEQYIACDLREADYRRDSQLRLLALIRKIRQGDTL